MEKHINRNRSFDRLSYTIYDKKAREAMVKYLTANNYMDIVSIENYNFDISAKKDKDYFFDNDTTVSILSGFPSTPAFVARRARFAKASINSGRQSGYPE